MVQLIFGAKGSGKTKKIIAKANDCLKTADGYIVYVTDTDRYRYDINNKIKYIDVTEFGIESERGLAGFIKGLISGNYDIQYLFIDGAHRIANKDICDLENFYNDIGALAEKFNVTFVLTVSKDEEDLPKFLKKYI